MELLKTYCELDSDIICEHKTVNDAGDFFHNHDGYELFLLLHGSINYYMEGEGLCLERGNLICIRPYDFHGRGMAINDAYDRIVINVRKTVLDNMSSEKTDLSTCFYRMPAGKINMLHLNEQEIMQYTLLAHNLIRGIQSNEYGNDILVDTYIKQILIMINQNARNHKNYGSQNIMPTLVADTITYIEQHLLEDITLDILSDQLHYNGTYISRSFKNITGISLQQYIIGKRITLAKKYLSEGYTPYDTCYMSGFNDYSNFSRTFTKQVGLSPKKFQMKKDS